MGKERLLELTESAVAWGSRLPLCAIAGILAVTGLFTGSVLFVRPKAAIALQKKFYEKINWRIEPVSMEKEIRNTRLMGLFTFIFSLASLYFILFTDLFCP